MYAILKLSGQEYVDQYAAVAKAEEAAAQAEEKERKFPRAAAELGPLLSADALVPAGRGRP